MKSLDIKPLLALGVIAVFGVLMQQGACSPETRDEIPETRADLAGVDEASTTGTAPEPDPTPEIDPEPKRGIVEVADSMYELGRKTERLYQELDPMAKTVVFMECLEEKTGKHMRGPDLERHIKRNSKESQACRKRLIAMSDDEIREHAMKRVEESKAEKK
jgi:hypothetical protein